MGVAPLPPLVGQDMAAIGRTNDAILYGANVQLWIDDGDAQLAQLSQQVPSAASKDFGEPFAEIFARYDHDFYRIDPLLFSPARVSLQNVRTGKVFAGGSVRTDILHASFGTVAEPTHPLGNGDDGATASEAAADA